MTLKSEAKKIIAEQKRKRREEKYLKKFEEKQERERRKKLARLDKEVEIVVSPNRTKKKTYRVNGGRVTVKVVRPRKPKRRKTSTIQKLRRKDKHGYSWLW